MNLDKKKLLHLKSIGHRLNPVVRLGQKGLTEAVTEELNRALDHHELVKVKVTGAERDTRTATIDLLASATASEVVHKIGQVALLYRRNEKSPVIEFPR